MSAKILTLDIETAPNLAHVWQLWDQNIGLSQLLESGHVMCFAAKWHGDRKTLFYSEFAHGQKEMLAEAYALVNEADVVVHFNGKRFDMPWLNSEWVRMGYTPPAPYAEVDLYQVVKSRFKFPSNKLDYVAGELLGERKVKNGGHGLWIACLNGDEKAWRTMERYNRKDVVLTERLYDRIRPWVPNLPNPALYTDEETGEMVCPECGSANLKKEGYSYTKISKYQRYSCLDCGRWSRDARRIDGVDLR
jgi:DNA polymerase elongation subunit (family B)